MKLLLLAVDKMRTPYLKEGCRDYLRRINKLTPVEVREIKPGKGDNPQKAIEAEQKKLLEAAEAPGYKKVALHPGGKSLTSAQFARLLKGMEDSGATGAAFIIGGAHGLGEKVAAGADYKITLGPMTLSHELARLVLLEQIYRAQTVLRGVPYAK